MCFFTSQSIDEKNKQNVAQKSFSHYLSQLHFFLSVLSLFAKVKCCENVYYELSFSIMSVSLERKLLYLLFPDLVYSKPVCIIVTQ